MSVYHQMACSVMMLYQGHRVDGRLDFGDGNNRSANISRSEDHWAPIVGPCYCGYSNHELTMPTLSGQ